MANGPTLPPQAYTREILTSAFNWLQSQPESVRKIATTPDALVGLYLRAQRYGSSSLEADAPVSSQNFISDLKNLAEGLKEFEAPQGGRKSAPSAVLSTTKTSAAQASLAASLASEIFAAASSHAAHARPAAMPTRAPSPTTAPSSASPTQHTQQGQATHQARHAQVIGHSTHHSQSVYPVPPPGPSHRLPTEPSAPAISQTYGQPHSQTHEKMAAETRVTSVSMTSTTSTAMASLAMQPATSQISGILSERSLAMIQEVKDRFNLSSDAEAINMLVSIAFKKTKDLLS